MTPKSSEEMQDVNDQENGRSQSGQVTFRTLRGAFSKVSRTPMRSTTLLAAGGLLGGLAGWVVGRRAVRAPPHVGLRSIFSSALVLEISFLLNISPRCWFRRFPRGLMWVSAPVIGDKAAQRPAQLGVDEHPKGQGEQALSDALEETTERLGEMLFEAHLAL